MLGLNDQSIADELGARVLRALGRLPAIRLFWGVGKTAVIALFTLGFGPAFLWAKRTERLIQNEAQQLWHLTEWLRLHTGNPRAGDLLNLANRSLMSKPLRLGASILATLVLLFMIEQTIQHRLSLESFLSATYLHFWLNSREPVCRQIFWTWTIGVCLVYLLIWLAIPLHVRDLERYLNVLKDVARDEGIAEQTIPLPRARPRARWIVTGITLSLLSAIWAIPLMFCGGLLWSYQIESGKMRAAIGELFARFLNARRPLLGAPATAWMDRCGNWSCRQELPADAKVCPRCGQPVLLEKRKVKVAGG